MKKIMVLSACVISVLYITSCKPDTNIPTPVKSPVPALATQSCGPSNPVASPANTHIAPYSTEQISKPTDQPMSTDELNQEVIIEDIEKVGWTQEQYDKVTNLLYGALAIRDFRSIKSLTNSDFYYFVNEILNDSYDFSDWNVGLDEKYNYNYIKDGLVEKIINSAFGINFKSGYRGGEEDGIGYIDGKYVSYVMDEQEGYSPFVYSIVPISPTEFRLLMDVTEEGGDGYRYYGKAQAVIKEDKNSIFGFNLVSFTKLKETKVRISRVGVSSEAPAEGGETFKAQYAIDGKERTSWMAKKGAGEWIKLTFDKPYSISGVVLFNNNEMQDNNSPDDVLYKFSDGTSLESNGGIYTFNYFGKTIVTDYIMIKIRSVNNSEQVALSEIQIH